MRVDESNEVQTESNLERRTHRQFSAGQKPRLLAKYDALERDYKEIKQKIRDSGKS